MKTTVELFRMEIDVTFDESKTFEYTTSCGDVYEQSAVTDDGRLIGFDEAVCAWVQLAGEIPANFGTEKVAGATNTDDRSDNQ